MPRLIPSLRARRGERRGAGRAAPGRPPAPGPAGEAAGETAGEPAGEPPAAPHPADDARPRPPAVDRPAGTGLGVPAFAHPLVAAAEWAELARPGTPLDWVAFDVRRGPGTRPDPLYADALAHVRENGVPLLGRLDAAHGARGHGELVADAVRYRDWYPVDGFYLDLAPTSRAEAAGCARTVAALRALLPRPALVVLAPGTHPDPGYTAFADQIVTFHGPWTRYRWSETPQWTADHPPGRFVHLVHGLPGPHLETALRIARWHGAGTVCVTDRTDRGGEEAWAGLPTYWHEAVEKVRRERETSM